MNVYIAARSQARARAASASLKDAGHTIVSSWVTDNNYGSDSTPSALEFAAVLDEREIQSCDALVCLSDPDGEFVPGGKHVELGIALALRKKVFVCGRRENVFHYHPLVTACGSVADVVRRV
jgi:nucleoside 2-deoxyribosyltransferase